MLMACAAHAASAAPPSRHNAYARFRDQAHHLWRAYWDRRQRRATVLILSSLDEHTLQDLGLDRTEIESVVYGRPSERNRHFEGSWE
jgi:uncharacterized protein YjiS (DUF1127 family)